MDDMQYRYEYQRGQGKALQSEERETGPPQSKVVLALCWVALIAMIVCNALFESMKLGGVTSAEVSNEVFAWFAPAGYVFAIWGVIYAALAVWMLTATWRSMKRQTVTMREGVLFVLSCALNIGWLAAFHFKLIELSLVVIVALWFTMLLMYSSIKARREPLTTRIPFSLYFGWLTVAVCANVAHLAARWSATPLIANEVSTIAIVVGLLVAAFVVARTQNDLVFPLVVLWAAVGVGVHLMQVDFTVARVLFALSVVGALAIYIPAVVRMVSSRSAGPEPLAGE